MNQFLTHSDYRQVLQALLEGRQARNPGYSQRAFARDLGIRSGRLSEVMNGKQGLSRRSGESIARKAGLSDLEAGYFADLVVQQHGRRATERRAAAERLKRARKEIPYQQLKLDRFKLIADWYHLAIIELAKTKDFEASAEWIAKALSLSVPDVNEALERLERVELLKREHGAWAFKSVDTLTPGGVSSEAIKKFHTQLLDKSKEALAQQSLAEREFFTVMLSVDLGHLPAIKERIDLFWKSIDRDFGSGGSQTEVYSLGIQFFNLTKGKSSEA